MSWFTLDICRIHASSFAYKENLSQYHEIYEEWISVIENGSFAEETVTMRLSCAGVLHNSATWLLTDPAKVLGIEACFKFSINEFTD